MFAVCFVVVFACALETATVVPSGVTGSAVNVELTAVTKTASPAMQKPGRVKPVKKTISKKSARVFSMAGPTPAYPVVVTSAAQAATPVKSTVDKQETVSIRDMATQVIPPLETRALTPAVKK